MIALQAGAIVLAVRLLAWGPAWSAGWLPFNTDGWFTPVLGHWYRAMLSGSSATAFYPVGHYAAFGDPQPVAAILIWLLEVLVGRFAAVWLFWLVVPAVYASAWAAAVSLAGMGAGISVLFALFVTCNNYFWAVTDDLIWVLPFWLPIGLVALQALRRRNGWKIAGVSFGLQAYTGVYPYLLQSGFLVSALVAGLIVPFKRHLPNTRLVLRALLLSLFLALPMFAWLSYEREMLEPVDPLRSRTVLYTTGLQPDDFFRHLDTVLIFPATPYRQPPPNPWVAQRRVAGVGFVLPLLALAGCVMAGLRAGLAAFTLFGVWILLAMGPVLHTDSGAVKLPMLWVYDHVPLADFFRVPSRAFGVVVLGLGLFAVSAWRRIRSRWLPGLAGTLATIWLAALFLLENTPVPAPAWDNRALLSAPAVGLPAGEVAAFIPSDLGWDVRFADRAIHPYAREAAYVMMALDLGLKVPNGVNGYIPRQRIDWRDILRRWQLRPEIWKTDPHAIPLVVQPSLALPEEEDAVQRLLTVLRDRCQNREEVWLCTPSSH